MGQLFTREEDIKTKLADAKNRMELERVQDLTAELDRVQNQIGDICAERNRTVVEQHLHPFEDNVDGGTPQHIWSLKRSWLQRTLMKLL